MTPTTIRPEECEDADRVRLVNRHAFGRSSEAALVDALRDSADAISLVATVATRIVGHILFTLVQVGDGKAGPSALRRSPYCRSTSGRALVRNSCGRVSMRVGSGPWPGCGCRAPDVLPEVRLCAGLDDRPRVQHPVPPEAFMVLELQAGALTRARGIVRYRQITKA